MEGGGTLVVVVLAAALCFGALYFGFYWPPARAFWKRLDDKAAEADARIVCPSCHEKGHVRTEITTVKSGLDGGKATAGILTGGATLPLTGLSRDDLVQRRTCGNCASIWLERIA